MARARLVYRLLPFAFACVASWGGGDDGVAGGGIWGGGLRAQEAPGAAAEVRLLTIDGVINPLTARYLERELARGAADGASAVVVRLDTPGGLETSMRHMVESILGSPLPVIVHVAPPGAHAASAGMFLVVAAHVAAMAPGTNIGAAHPVTIGAEGADETMAEKMVNDAAALARAIAERRGRNAAWAESAVRQSVSITAGEALEQGVIDLLAEDLDGLLAAVDGRSVEVAGAQVTLRTRDARVVERPMSLPERILHALTDPNIAYLLFTVGFIGVIAELYNPGAIFPGATGAVSLILAFVSFGSLPVNWAAVLLLVLGMGVFALDLMSEGVGALSFLGVVAFVLGSLMLYSPFTPTSPAMPDVQVSRGLVAAAVAMMASVLILVGRAMVRTRGAPVAIGTPALVGRSGVALSHLAPRGMVRVDGETWSATVEGTDGGAVAAGERVQVVGLEGVTLRVRRGPGAVPPAGEPERGGGR